MKPVQTSPRRLTHRKRLSALRLSSDTTATLPEYIATGAWSRSDPEPPSDLPPDYPDSAEEADEDTDEDEDDGKRSPYVPQLTGLHSPRGGSRPKRHRRKASSPSSSDLYLDSLLERSVHALEMSNTLLQSSMSTQNTLSNVFSVGSPGDSTLEVSARGLSSRIRDNKDVHEVWADDLAEISRGVERLFGDNSSEEQVRSRKDSRDSLSSSVPTSTSPIRQHRRRPSLDLRSTSERPQLRYDRQDRGQLVSHPPRALTQYVVAETNGHGELEGIILPSTLGLRSAASHHAAPSSPIITDRPPEPSTKAYNMLSSFVTRPNPSPTSARSSRRGSSNSTSVERPSSSSRRQSKQSSPERSTTRSTSSRSSSRTSRHKPSPSPYSHAGPSGSSSSSSLTITSNTNSSSHSHPYSHNSHSQSLSHIHHYQRPMTPPQEESSSSSDSCTAKQTISALRKILDEQPPPPLPPNKSRPPPSIMRIKTAPPAQAGTSTATASISRLFTKPTHTSSTRPPSPPRISSMKGKGRSGSGMLTPVHSRGGSLSAPTSLGGSGVTTPGSGAASSLTFPSLSPLPSPSMVPSSAPASQSKFGTPGLPANTSASSNLDPNNMSFSDMFGAVSAKLALGNYSSGNSSSNVSSADGGETPNTSGGGSGMSTPKRISFVEPLDGTIKARRKGKGRASLIGSIIGGVGSGDKGNDGNGEDDEEGAGSGNVSRRRRRKKSLSRSSTSNRNGSLRRGRGSGRRQGSGDSRDEVKEKESWWMGWLVGAGYGTGAGSTMRPESRGGMGMGWGGGAHGRTGSGGYSSGLDDWTV
ncbi:hypothetical protein K435DRAFT_222092 [Dendrothele bispora CBS 962.96]|uniref:Uncharacterized protein n=1 Tax=Dendrothele bispora (strain CBS 962.96) TaxID=1314807 RepID=A0A4S8LRL3_DENBC|nr:hypothetical protein K435DRAFT_222092 [Dendrothele bispora CBS 962.96]